MFVLVNAEEIQSGPREKKPKGFVGDLFLLDWI